MINRETFLANHDRQTLRWTRRNRYERRGAIDQSAIEKI